MFCGFETLRSAVWRLFRQKNLQNGGHFWHILTLGLFLGGQKALKTRVLQLVLLFVALLP